MKNEIEYSDLIKLGFKRFELGCEVDFAKNGHYPVGLKLSLHRKDKFMMEWMDEERVVKLTKTDREGTIKSCIEMDSLEDVKRHINLFKGISNEEVVSTPLMA